MAKGIKTKTFKSPLVLRTVKNEILQDGTSFKVVEVGLKKKTKNDFNGPLPEAFEVSATCSICGCPCILKSLISNKYIYRYCECDKKRFTGRKKPSPVKEASNG
jgi:hypothetical protein